MSLLPYRTHATWLTDAHLILLDQTFCYTGVPFQALRDRNYRPRWNLRYSHGLTDPDLKCNLRWLCEHGVLATHLDRGGLYFEMTPYGGELWSQERCPIWERYCLESYREFDSGRATMRVVAFSADVRDHFLDVFPEHPPRRSSAATIRYDLIPWLPPSQVFVGLVVCENWSFFQSTREHWARIERQRSWWRSVSELQRFVGAGVRQGLNTDT